MQNQIKLDGWKLEECHDEGIFNGSYMITRPDDNWPDDEDERSIVCRFPTSCGKFSAQYPYAKLIAAAPDLLAACQELLGMVDEMLPKYGPCGWGTIATDNARAAISKALGQ